MLSLSVLEQGFIIGVNLPAGFDNFVRRFGTKRPRLVVQLSLRNSVIEGLEMNTAAIGNGWSILCVRTIEPARLLWFRRIIEAAGFKCRCGCTCAAGSHMQFTCAKMGVVQQDRSWELDGSH